MESSADHERLSFRSRSIPLDRIPIRSSRRRSFDTATSRWFRLLRCTSTTWQPGTSTLLKQQEVPGGFDSALYGSERVWVEAADGVKIPVSVVYRRDKFKRDSKNPALSLWIWVIWISSADRLQRLQIVAAGPWCGDRICTHSWWRRDGRFVARRWKDDGETQYVFGLHRGGRATGREGLWSQGSESRSRVEAPADC